MKLDKIQQEAVDSKESKIVVVAGAGSGKTRVLTERVRRLIRDGVEPHNIVCITFTNMAAQEMIERLAGTPGIGDAFIGTIHSFANRIYKHSGISYEILTPEKELELYQYILNKFKKYPNLRYDKYLKYLDHVKLHNEGKIPEGEMQRFLLPSENHDLRNAKEELEQICIQRNILNFDALLKETTEYYKSIGATIEHVLVDEFQDVGTNEFSFISNLKAKNLFIVGDDWQSIYGFKGGNVSLFKTIVANRSFKVFKMGTNYRNCSQVSSVAKIVIDQVCDKLDKEVNTVSEKVGSVQFDNKSNLRLYLNKIKKEGNFKDWFILARSNKEVFEISDVLEELNIPYVGFKRGNISLEDMKELIKMDSIKLLTVHTSKGLESKNVLLYGNFPLRQKSFLKNTDERKVMYVGVTRAEENLIVLN